VKTSAFICMCFVSCLLHTMALHLINSKTLKSIKHDMPAVDKPRSNQPIQSRVCVHVYHSFVLKCQKATFQPTNPIQSRVCVGPCLHIRSYNFLILATRLDRGGELQHRHYNTTLILFWRLFLQLTILRTTPTKHGTYFVSASTVICYTLVNMYTLVREYVILG